MPHWHWHRSKRSKKSQQPQNIDQQQFHNCQEHPQNAQIQHQITPQQPYRTESTYIQTDHSVHSKPKSPSYHFKSYPVYTNSPPYVQQQPNTVYYVVQQPTAPCYVQQQPPYMSPYMMQDPYYHRRVGFMDSCLLFVTGLLIGDLLFFV